MLCSSVQSTDVTADGSGSLDAVTLVADLSALAEVTQHFSRIAHDGLPRPLYEPLRRLAEVLCSARTEPRRAFAERLGRYAHAIKMGIANH